MEQLGLEPATVLFLLNDRIAPYLRAWKIQPLSGLFNAWSDADFLEDPRGALSVSRRKVQTLG